MKQLDLEDYLVIATDVLAVDPTALTAATELGLADSALHAPFASFGGQDFYPDFGTKAGILASRLMANHPLPDGNKRTALLAMIEFVERNGHEWLESDQDAIADHFERGAAGSLSEPAFVEWVAARVT